VCLLLQDMDDPELRFLYAESWYPPLPCVLSCDGLAIAPVSSTLTSLVLCAALHHHRGVYSIMLERYAEAEAALKGTGASDAVLLVC